MPKLRHLVIIAILIWSHSAAFADTFNPRVNTITRSKNGKIKVFSKVNEKTYAASNGQVLWTIEKYVKFGYVSDDGRYFVALYGGGNLIPLDASSDLVLLKLYCDGKLFREVRLSEIIDDMSQLIATASHFYWGDAIGFVESNKFVVRRTDGKVFVLDIP